MFSKGSVVTKCDEKSTSLHHVVQTDDETSVENLISAGCDVNMKNHNGDPPLASAIRKNCVKATKILLSAGAKLENDYFRNLEGPLHIAAEKGFFEIVQLLIQNGADVNARNIDSETPLHSANKYPWLGLNTVDELNDRCKIIKTLIDAGAEINAKNKHGSTPLGYSVYNKFEEGFKLLLSLGADVNVKGYSKKLLLFESVTSMRQSQRELLIKHGANIYVNDEDGNSLLHEAFAKANFEFMEFLLDKGLSINKVNNKGYDPLCEGLFLWSTAGYLDRMFEFYYMPEKYKVVNLAIKCGANVNHITTDGMTSLYLAINNNRIYRYDVNVRIVQTLLNNGAIFDFEHPLVQKVMNLNYKAELKFLLLRQIALSHAQDRDGLVLNFDLEKLAEEMQNYYVLCRRELEVMKVTKIADMSVSLFNIFVKKDLSGYTRNESIVSAIEERNASMNLYLYNDTLTDRFFREMEDQKLVRVAANGLCNILNWDESSMREIVDCILSHLYEKDLKNLAKFSTHQLPVPRNAKRFYLI